MFFGGERLWTSDYFASKKASVSDCNLRADQKAEGVSLKEDCFLPPAFDCREALQRLPWPWRLAKPSPSVWAASMESFTHYIALKAFTQIAWEQLSCNVHVRVFVCGGWGVGRGVFICVCTGILDIVNTNIMSVWGMRVEYKSECMLELYEDMCTSWEIRQYNIYIMINNVTIALNEIAWIIDIYFYTFLITLIKRLFLKEYCRVDFPSFHLIFCKH